MYTLNYATNLLSRSGLDNIKWLFFDIGSALVDESKSIEQRCRTITSKNSIN